MSYSKGENSTKTTTVKTVRKASKGQLNAALLHELRNFVANMGCALEQISMTAEGEIAQLAAAATQTFNDATNLLNSGLNLEAVHAGKFNKAKTNIGKFVSSTAFMVEHGAFARKHVTLLTSVGQDVPETMMMDAARTRQVLVNFLLNAVKFSSPGSVVRLTAAYHPGKNSVGFCVQDEGPGMSQTACQQLFNPFVQAKEGAKKVDSTGLGLYISRMIVEGLGGAIGVDSKEGEGSTFYCQLPFNQPNEKTMPAVV